MEFDDLFNGSSSQGGGGMTTKEKMILAGVGGLAVLFLVSRGTKNDEDGVDRTVYVPTSTYDIQILGDGSNYSVDNSSSYGGNITNNGTLQQEQSNNVPETTEQVNSNYTLNGHIEYLDSLTKQNNPGLNSWVQTQLVEYDIENLDAAKAAKDSGIDLDNEQKYLENLKVKALDTKNDGLLAWVKAQGSKYGLVI